MSHLESLEPAAGPARVPSAERDAGDTHPAPSAAPGGPSSAASGSAWLDALRLDVESHPAVRHPLLARTLSRADVLAFGLQHYALVGFFTTYMEALLVAAPGAAEKLWLAKVLVNEYGEGSDGRDHPTLYREFLAGAGGTAGEEERTPLLPEAMAFVRDHVRLCAEEPFLVGLGALGPGHEWAIPHMFGRLVTSLRRAGIAEEALLYFTLHAEQDVDHGAWMTQVLSSLVRSEDERALVRRGALFSLERRARLWTGIARRLERTLESSSPAGGEDLRDLRRHVRAMLRGAH